MEQLENSEDKKNKFIIFDDPMNSNDDTMQYLIITEIQKLYQGKYKNRFNANNDFFICMTHNAHFYLNVQPRKLFNVNSHAVDDLSAELIGKNKEDILEMFKEIFYNNNANEHYDNYNKRWTLLSENQ